MPKHTDSSPTNSAAPAAPNPAPQTVVLKLGSSVLTCESDFDVAVREIRRQGRLGCRVVAVVSAIGDTTDELVARAERWGPDSPPCALAALLATGEAASAALLTMALAASGRPSSLLDAVQLQLRTTGPTLDATLVSVDVDALTRALDQTGIAVVPGFVGLGDENRCTLLGRGGSDLSALFLAWKLGAACRLLKDVDGIYDRDPAKDPTACRYAQLHWDDAIRIGGPVVQPKATAWARDRGVAFEVAQIGDVSGTLVNGGPARLAVSVGDAFEREGDDAVRGVRGRGQHNAPAL